MLRRHEVRLFQKAPNSPRWGRLRGLAYAKVQVKKVAPIPRALGGSKTMDPTEGSVIYTIGVLESRVGWILPGLWVCFAVLLQP